MPRAVRPSDCLRTEESGGSGVRRAVGCNRLVQTSLVLVYYNSPNHMDRVQALGVLADLSIYPTRH